MAKETVDFDNMSDEDFLRLGPPTVTEPAAVEQQEQQEQEQEQEGQQEQQENEEEQEQEQEQEEQEEGEEEQEQEETLEPELDDQGQPVKKVPVKAKDPEEQQEQRQQAKPAKKAGKEAADADEFDVEDAKRLFGQFKANGRNMNIRNADEGIRLMQMGANYSQKMEELKPKLGVLRTLEREGLLDEGKLAFLIDLHKKNPQAIGKLVKDAEFDPLAVDDEVVKGYKPGDYSTSQQELDLDAVLGELKDEPHYRTLVDTVANKWDKRSKDAIGENPGVLRVFSQHMGSGVYDRVMDEVARQKALGNLGGIPMLQAYQQVGDQLEKSGALNDLITQPQQQKGKLVTPGKEKARQVREEDDKRRRAAAPTRKTGNPAPKKPVTDVWTMSDDDFAKLNV